MATTSSQMTTEELLALPDDGMYRELIDGELREYAMTARGGPHCLITTNLTYLFESWRHAQPRPRGRVYVGDARIRLRRDPDTFVGADIVYLTPEQAARTPWSAKFIDEPTALVVEIGSPRDTAEMIAEKVRAYLAYGVPYVWEVNAFYQSVQVHQPNSPQQVFSGEQEFAAEPYLPGLRIIASDIFAD